MLGFGFASWRRFRETDHAYMMALAHQCAQALDRAQLYANARTAEEASRKHAVRVQVLADLGDLFAETQAPCRYEGHLYGVPLAFQVKSPKLVTVMRNTTSSWSAPA